MYFDYTSFDYNLNNVRYNTGPVDLRDPQMLVDRTFVTYPPPPPPPPPPSFEDISQTPGNMKCSHCLFSRYIFIFVQIIGKG